jgi:hypothetical protein
LKCRHKRLPAFCCVGCQSCCFDFDLLVVAVAVIVVTAAAAAVVVVTAVAVVVAAASIRLLIEMAAAPARFSKAFSKAISANDDGDIGSKGEEGAGGGRASFGSRPPSRSAGDSFAPSVLFFPVSPCLCVCVCARARVPVCVYTCGWARGWAGPVVCYSGRKFAHEVCERRKS